MGPRSRGRSLQFWEHCCSRIVCVPSLAGCLLYGALCFWQPHSVITDQVSFQCRPVQKALFWFYRSETLCSSKTLLRKTMLWFWWLERLTPDFSFFQLSYPPEQHILLVDHSPSILGGPQEGQLVPGF